MQDFNPSKVEQFFTDYRTHTLNFKVGSKHISEASEILDFSKNCKLLHYRSSAPLNSRIFVIVPSIFNSVEILFLNKQAHFVKRLRTLGSVYIIKWLEIENTKFNLNDYTLEAVKVIKYIHKKVSENISLIGHCIGGNIAIAASLLAAAADIAEEDLVNDLTLLTTPWDFSHFKHLGSFHEIFNLDKKLETLSFVPAIYTKILFFMLAPDYFNLKIDKYFDLANAKDKQLFMEVEHWLISGISIPKATYFQIVRDIMIENKPAKQQWIIDNVKVMCENLKLPVFIMIAKNDQLVPKSSILPLYNGIKNVNLMEVSGGHISYLVGPGLSKFFKQYSNWLNGEI
jgi:polyhydroxyalkanoate synthase